MEVILLEKIQNLGTVGDKVKVRPGYGRNYLLPQGKAVSATEETIAKFEERRAELEKRATETLAAAQARHESMSEAKIKIEAKASDEGKLYGSIGTRDIAIAATEAGYQLNKNEVLLPGGVIRSIGEFEIALQLHPDVSSSIKLEVTPAK
ncbi:MAG: 50S ribosomal protein L9 [Gammaproteobacteria bacterium]|nr:50S ribosomal protein L9 [Gammaproteobacteria bacterium]MDH5692150.1 50S ribosomal protein L9 [Gammaproteobacteria bacterium]